MPDAPEKKSLVSTSTAALGLMDLTTLGYSDTHTIVRDLAATAKTSHGSPAAVCVFPRFVHTARKALKSSDLVNVKIATVTNFPEGGSDVETAVIETKAAVAYGADEVDVVFPYKSLIDGDEKVGADIVSGCKKECGDKVKLKVIIESGELKTPELIKKASEICIENGADFIKTSTGKVPVNATLEASRIMLQAIKDSGKDVGFKAAGGIKTAKDAAEYLAVAEEIMGPSWATPETFRFGASSLLSNLVADIEGRDAAQGEGY